MFRGAQETVQSVRTIKRYELHEKEMEFIERHTTYIYAQNKVKSTLARCNIHTMHTIFFFPISFHASALHYVVNLDQTTASLLMYNYFLSFSHNNLRMLQTNATFSLENISRERHI